MRLDNVVLVSGRITPQAPPPEKVARTKPPVQELPKPEPANKEKKVSAEELMSKIKELSNHGEYSVRFEVNDDINDLVIKVVSREDGKVIRQIPSEELINISKTLRDLRGLMVDTAS
jgi:flagellar protein FlaG